MVYLEGENNRVFSGIHKMSCGVLYDVMVLSFIWISNRWKGMSKWCNFLLILLASC